MASPPADPDAASRTGLSPSRNSAPDAQRRPDPVQLSAADCSVGDDSGAVASSVALTAPAAAPADEHAAASSSSQVGQPPPPRPPPPLPFEPLFALLTNTTTGATVHPRVHYLFSDDDASIPTDDAAADAAAEHRSLVVDLTPTPAHDAWSVAYASSLGPEFAVTAAALSKQQSEGSSTTTSSSAAEPNTGGSSGGGGGTGHAAALMLHVEGVSRDPVDLRASAEAVNSAASLRSSASGGGGGGAGREDLETLADDFRRRMGILKKVVGEGEKRRAAVAQQHDDHDHDHDHDGNAGDSNEIHDPGMLRSRAASQSHDAAAATSISR
ncbi:chitinase 18-3 [Cordyceps javanica]|uniref:Chitinase 18-3 n=1 Tax=Cordyceps javanica TaxID=43265 RepID=A0A545VA68_9HYPO|nr:chitinase 18-3 [Cordyceps javanica]TQW09715.1 chitinase 18-3 [Cordyceps javanica]